MNEPMATEDPKLRHLLALRDAPPNLHGVARVYTSEPGRALPTLGLSSAARLIASVEDLPPRGKYAIFLFDTVEEARAYCDGLDLLAEDGMEVYAEHVWFSPAPACVSLAGYMRDGFVTCLVVWPEKPRTETENLESAFPLHDWRRASACP
jgi:hypothetical protein